MLACFELQRRMDFKSFGTFNNLAVFPLNVKPGIGCQVEIFFCAYLVPPFVAVTKADLPGRSSNSLVRSSCVVWHHLTFCVMLFAGSSHIWETNWGNVNLSPSIFESKKHLWHFNVFQIADGVGILLLNSHHKLKVEQNNAMDSTLVQTI